MLDGLDALVLTAGIGEYNARVRDEVGRRLHWRGIELDPRAPVSGARRISADDSKVAVWVLPTSEERMLCLHALELLERLQGECESPSLMIA